uniref:Uncharacterized protein n=1 Tax=Phytophthora ramorum TaxID=164328 RepID=H3GZD7_PHYRM
MRLLRLDVGFLAVVLLAPVFAFDTAVRVYEVNESPSCTVRSTAMFSTVVSAPCMIGTPCSEEFGPDGNSSQYEFCGYSQAEYLKLAYGDTFYVLLEHYKDANCEKLTATDVFRADGRCHNSLHYALQVTIDPSGGVTIRSRDQTCESGDWANVIDPVPGEKVNTDECFTMETHSGKLFLLDGTEDASASTSASSGSTATTATELLSSTSALRLTPSRVILIALVILCDLAA